MLLNKERVFFIVKTKGLVDNLLIKVEGNRREIWLVLL